MAIKFLNTVAVDTDVLYVDASSNRVGIGTTSPNAKLDIQGTQGQLFSVTDDLSGDIFSVADISGVPIMNINSDGTSYFDGKVEIGTSTVAIANAAADDLWLRSTGSNGITISSGNAHTGTIFFGDEANAAAAGFRYNHNTGDMAITAEDNITFACDNVGIGTTSPQQKLHIVSTDGANIILNSNTGAENNGIWMTEGGIAAPYANGAYFHYDSSANLVKLNTGTTTLSTRFVVQRDTGKFIVGGANANQTQSVMSSRQNGSSIEFGHLNQNGQYYGTLGAMASSGSPFIAFSADNSVANSFTTRGAKGFVISQDTNISGDLIFSSVPLVNTANQGLVERMRITSTGNVGIGTTSPQEQLHLYGGNLDTRELGISDAANVIYLNTKNGPSAGGGTGIGAGLVWAPYFSGYTKRSAGIMQIAEGNYFRSALAFYTNNTSNATTDWSERMRISMNGNVGIGTTSPSQIFTIENNSGFFRINTSTSTYPRIEVGSASGSTAAIINRITGSQNIVFGESSDSGNYIFRGGNVGIGTTSPGAKLQIDSASLGQNINDTTTQAIFNSSNVNQSNLYIQDYRTAAGNDWTYSGKRIQEKIDATWMGYMQFNGDSNNGGISFGTGLSTTQSSVPERMRITGGGNVGIGTANPLNKLFVSANTAGDYAAFIENANSTSGYGLVARTAHTGTSSYAFAARAGSSDIFVVRADGNVGIGTTSPSEKLEVAGNARITGDVTLSNGNALRWTSDDVRIEGTTAGDNIKFYVANTEILQLAQSGTLATVTGDLRVTGAYYDSSNLAGTSGQVLSSTATGTDWVSLSEISGVDGTGIINYVAKWSGLHTITGSVIYDDGINVGIGTASPSYKLDVNGGLHSSNINIADGIYHEGDTNNYFQFATDTQKFVTSGTERMRITSTGNVGIGTTSPSAPLDVFGVRAGRDWAIADRAVIRLDSNGVSKPSDIVFGHTAAANQTSWTGAYWSLSSRGSSADNKFIFYRGNGNPDGSGEATIMTFDPDLNVGIGTTDPQSKLHLATTGGSTLTIQNTTNSGNAALNFRDEGNNDQFQIYYALGANRSYNLVNGNGLTIYSSQTSTEIARFGNASSGYTDSYFTGNVGIGTTSPTAAKLVVDSSTAPQILVKNTGGGNAKILFEDNTGLDQNASITFDQTAQNTLTIATGYQSPTDLNRINIAPAGNIGLTVRGGTGGSGLGQPLVGIGTTSPSEKLEVNGNIKIQSALLSNQENTDIDTGAEVVAQVAHATYTAAFFDFVVKKGTNVRSGTVYACHNGDTTPLVEFTETSTQDLGDTSDVTLSVDISGANMRLLATVTSDDWTVKSLIRAI